jgi:hypothetical protein
MASGVARYCVSLRVEFEQGTRPSGVKVTWSCTRLPGTRIDGGVVTVYYGEQPHPEELGELFGIYRAMQHAEANGESLSASDIDLAYESLTHVFKRRKIDHSLQGRSYTRGVSRHLYDAVNARKRPLGSGV